MPSLWFVMPVHGRTRLASICVKQLRRACDGLAERGVKASAMLVGTRRDLADISALIGGLLGFGWKIRNNRSVSRRFNDGIQLAVDGRYNPRPVDYVVPCGSDDWVHPDALLPLPAPDTVRGIQTIAFVNETGDTMEGRAINTPGGWGVRVYPAALLAGTLAGRPAEEDRRMGCDTSILVNVRRAHGSSVRLEDAVVDPRLVVDWKSHGEQIHPFDSLYRFRPVVYGSPWEGLSGIYDDDLLEEMRAHYAEGEA